MDNLARWDREPEKGFEPLAPALQERCSDQLSYSGARPMVVGALVAGRRRGRGRVRLPTPDAVELRRRGSRARAPDPPARRPPSARARRSAATRASAGDTSPPSSVTASGSRDRPNDRRVDRDGGGEADAELLRPEGGSLTRAPGSSPYAAQADPERAGRRACGRRASRRRPRGRREPRRRRSGCPSRR